MSWEDGERYALADAAVLPHAARRVSSTRTAAYISSGGSGGGVIGPGVPSTARSTVST